MSYTGKGKGRATQRNDDAHDYAASGEGSSAMSTPGVNIVSCFSTETVASTVASIYQVTNSRSIDWVC